MIRAHLALLALLLAAPAAARAPTLAEIGAALHAGETMVARFRQLGPDGREATGTLTLKRPGKARFDYGPNAPILVVADGRRLTFIDYKVAQVSQWPLRETALAVLLDPAADLARVARLVPEAEMPVPGAIGVEARDPKRPDIGRILLLLRPDAASPGGYTLLGWRVIDAQGNRTVVELSDIRWNVRVADSLFRFRDPRLKGAPGRTG
ncbi:LolA family protein [Thermaurantiacus sp.]